FRNGDLYVVDMRGIPQRLVESVGKTQRHQVLNGLFAQIMVDTETLLFLEDMTDRVVQVESGCEITADRLFDNDTCRLGNQLVFADLVGDVAKNARCNGEVKCANAFLTFFQQLLERIPAIVGLRIYW